MLISLYLLIFQYVSTFYQDKDSFRGLKNEIIYAIIRVYAGRLSATFREESHMQEKTISSDSQKARTVPGASFQKRIGSSVFVVSVYFNQDAEETLNDKILRLVGNDLHVLSGCALKGVLQTARLPERASHEHQQADR